METSCFAADVSGHICRWLAKVGLIVYSVFNGMTAIGSGIFLLRNQSLGGKWAKKYSISK